MSTKSTKIRKILRPEHVTILIDSREKKPADVSPMKSLRATLPSADYTVLGLENFVAIERKSLQDFIQCVGRERERFEREIQRLRAFEVSAVVIEADWAHLELKQYRGEVSPEAAIGSALGWIASGINIVMAGDSERASKFIARLLFTAARRRWRESHTFIEAAKGEEG